MSRAENRHYTKKWKRKRKDYDGDKCHCAKCPICSAHKHIGNSKKRARKKDLQENSKLQDEIYE